MDEKLKLEYKAKDGWQITDAEGRKAVFNFNEDYKKFLDNAKTEREATAELVKQAKAAGFICLDDYICGDKVDEDCAPGTKVYSVNRGKSCAFAVIGKEDPMLGMNMVGSHIDSPRLDFKPAPIYEDSGFVLAKTHYYGGIKKYQWVATPLSLHGVIILHGGRTVNVCIGEDESDPVLYISDLLPHLSQDQMAKPAHSAISGEMLNVMLGSVTPEKAPEGEEDKSLKTSILELLNSKYGITEGDFFRAELEIVPAAKAKDVGLDRGLVGAYGQDDRVCAYTSFRALLDLDIVPEKTTVVYMSDKEEIGSVGNTGARSCWLENLCLELVHLFNSNYGMLETRRAMANTRFLSADVTAAFDPTFPEVSEKLNVSFCGKGIAFAKYTGSRGKSGASDASAELVADVLDVLDAANIPWQLTEMGKVDVGGGGTIAQFMADLGMDVLDCGTPVISMHSPFEVTSKADVYWSYRAYLAFMLR